MAPARSRPDRGPAPLQTPSLPHPPTAPTPTHPQAERKASVMIARAEQTTEARGGGEAGGGGGAAARLGHTSLVSHGAADCACLPGMQARVTAQWQSGASRMRDDSAEALARVERAREASAEAAAAAQEKLDGARAECAALHTRRRQPFPDPSRTLPADPSRSLSPQAGEGGAPQGGAREALCGRAGGGCRRAVAPGRARARESSSRGGGGGRAARQGRARGRSGQGGPPPTALLPSPKSAHVSSRRIN